MNVCQFKPNKTKISFQAVKVNTYIPTNDNHPQDYFNVEFTENDMVEASKVFKLKPANRESINTQMWLDKNTVSFEYEIDSLKDSFRGYTKGNKKGSRKFTQLCKIMQRVVPEKGEYMKEPEKAVGLIKKFFK